MATIKKSGVELIAEERKIFPPHPIRHFPHEDIGTDMEVIAKGLREAIDANDDRLLKILVGAGALIAAEIDRLQSLESDIKK
jgi:hypothetical protein